MRTLLIISAILFSLPALAQMQMLFGRNAGAGITSPLDVDSLFYWFDAGQGVFDSVGNTISNFQGVGEWKDLSGNGHHTTQTTNGQRPQYLSTGGANSRPAMYFDGTNDWLASAAHLWESADISAFIVHAYNNATRGSFENMFAKFQATTNKRQFRLMGTNTAPFDNRFSLWDSGTISPRKDYNLLQSKSTTYNLLSFTFLSPDLLAYKNGNLTATISQSGIIFDTDAPFSIGAGNVLSTPSEIFQGYISEIIIYSRALTTAERQAIENYLNKKYNLY
jgi:hypothetical protein